MRGGCDIYVFMVGEKGEGRGGGLGWVSSDRNEVVSTNLFCPFLLFFGGEKGGFVVIKQ